jgi:hypothetical protein
MINEAPKDQRAAVTYVTGEVVDRKQIAETDRGETAEAFVMKRMDPSEAAVYEEHLARCRACTKVFEMTRAFAPGMRDASRQLADD